MKRAKEYSALEDYRPTLRNKLSGLNSNWHCVAPKSTTHRQRVSAHARASSSSMSTPSLSTPSPSPYTEFDHTLSLVALSPPTDGKRSPPPFHGALVPLIDEDAVSCGCELHKVVSFTLLPPTVAKFNTETLPPIHFTPCLRERQRSKTATWSQELAILAA